MVAGRPPRWPRGLGRLTRPVTDDLSPYFSGALLPDCDQRGPGDPGMHSPQRRLCNPQKRERHLSGNDLPRSLTLQSGSPSAGSGVCEPRAHRVPEGCALSGLRLLPLAFHS